MEREMNEAENAGCRSLFDRNPDGAADYAEFKARFTYSFMGCWLGRWCGQTMGIEDDGYTHA